LAFALVSRARARALHVCAVLSGAAGLVYEVAWSKALGLVFGHSAHAVATCLAVFLGGLALGGASAAARPPTRGGRLLASYARLELAVAVAGASSVAGLALLQRLAWALPVGETVSHPARLALGVAGACAVLGPTTFLMGRTFPLLVLASRGPGPGTRLARVYALNTAGASAGALVTGFVMLPSLGLRATLAVAVGANVATACLALLAGRSVGSHEPPPDPRSVSAAATPSRPRGRAVALHVVFGVMGATALSYEVAWARLLGTMLGSSTYAATWMLATLLAGMALGAAGFSRLQERRLARVTVRALGYVQVAVASTALLFLGSFGVLPPLTAGVLRALGASFSSWTLAQAAVCVLAELPTATVIGFAFPLVVRLLQEPRGEIGGEPGAAMVDRDAGSIGQAYASNTTGAIAGALLAAFVLLPAMGAYRLVAATAAVNAVVAAGCFFAPVVASRTRGLSLLPVVGAGGLGAGLIWLASGGAPLPAALATFGAALYGDFRGSHLTFQEIVDTEDVVFAADGLTATVAVTRTEGYVGLKVNGKVDASTLDRSTQLLLGYLGGVLHPRPRRVLVIGLGSGMTVSAIARLPDVERIDCVEIEPALLRALPALQPLHRGVLSDPRVHLVFDDARSFVQAGGPPYDVVVSEPSNPWVTGVASLFTDEFYAAVRRRLAPGGMFVQWLQAYSLEPDDVRMVTGTLIAHFADLSLWRSENRDFILLGRTDPGPVDLGRARATWGEPALAEDLRALHVASPEGWLAYLRLGDAELRALAAGGAVSTDDRSPLEYRAPRAVMNEELVDRLDALVLDAQHIPLGGEIERADLHVAAMGAAASLLEMKSAWAARALAILSAEPASAPLEVLRGRGDLAAGRTGDALAHFQNAERLGADTSEVGTWRAAVAQARGDLPAAALLVDDVRGRSPSYAPALEVRAAVARGRRQWAMALDAERALGALRPSDDSHACELGDLLLRAGERREAERMLRGGLARERYAFLCRRDLGELERAESHDDEARRDLEFVVRYFPLRDSSVYRSLALLYRSVGRPGDADAILEKGRRLFPDDDALAQAPAPVVGG
jgi:spermidine synthase